MSAECCSAEMVRGHSKPMLLVMEVWVRPGGMVVWLNPPDGSFEVGGTWSQNRVWVFMVQLRTFHFLKSDERERGREVGGPRRGWDVDLTPGCPGSCPQCAPAP